MKIKFKLLAAFFLFNNTISFAQDSKQYELVKDESIPIISDKFYKNQLPFFEFNPFKQEKLFFENTVLEIPISKVPIVLLDTIVSPTIIIEKKTHIVNSGETLSKISKNYNIPLQDLKRLNPSVVKLLPTGYQLILKEEEIVFSSPQNNSIRNEIIVKEIATENSKDTLPMFLNVENIIHTSSKYLGTRYKKGGETSNGFDCSGFVYKTFKENEIIVPRTSKELANIGVKIPQSQAKIGDLIFFATNGAKTINHVGIIVEIIDDELKFIHSSLKLGVVVSSLKEFYYLKRFVQINRIF